MSNILDDLQENVGKLTRNQGALVGFIKLMVFLVIVAVVGYSDIQFILLMARMMPDGIARVFSVIGAFATGLSVIALIGAELFWFTRGKQMLAGWIFTGLELAISVMNLLTSFALASGHMDAFFTMYLYYLCPATPVVAAGLWILIFMVDEASEERHEEREMQSDMKQLERKHRKAAHLATMKLKNAYLQSYTEHLLKFAGSDEAQKRLKEGAESFGNEALNLLTGSFRLPLSPPTVTGSLADSTPVLPAKKEELKQTGPLAEMATAQEHPLPGQNGHQNGAKPA